jgi:hypothetical protein
MEMDTLINCPMAKGRVGGCGVERRPMENWTENVSHFTISCVEMNAKISELKDDLINGFDSANE